MNELGIKAYFGGLGDSLQFSTLPERFSELGYKVYLVDDAPFRTVKTKEIVWDDNPYILGQKNIEWKLGDTPGTKYENKFDNFIKNWEHIHGLIPKNEFPKIYYNPLWVDNIEGIIDISTVTLSYNTAALVDDIKTYIASNHPKLNFKIVSHEHNPIIDTFGFDVIYINGLKEYANVINSCKVFISVHSGQQALAASLRHLNKEFKQVCYMPQYDINFKGLDTTNETIFDNFMRRKFFIFPMVDYRKI
jgi:hypothetical protein